MDNASIEKVVVRWCPDLLMRTLIWNYPISKMNFLKKQGCRTIFNLVTQQRNVPIEIINEAMEMAEEMMITNGIVAVGDISSNTNSFYIKAKHNFILSHLY
ncbi:MAG: hypothetical protein IPO24_18595 [Bacteroidetes bacterium]|nr:hypothetical protein [Bacteroidota bacterium]